MNYERIYSEFIADRLAKQPVKPDYFEKHHIVPRHFGGGDEKSNIIRLTPEDHFFAHLLLAQIHGGHMWSCVLLLSGRRRFNTPWAKVVGKTRYGYGLAKRKHAEKERLKDGLKGSDNGNYNPALYEWINLDSGKTETKTLHDMWLTYGMSRGTWTSVASGKGDKPSAGGWALNDGTARFRSSKGKEFAFVNRDGRVFNGSQKEFCDSIGTSYGAGTRLVRHHGVTVCGWRLLGTDDRSHMATRATGHASQLNVGVAHKFEKEGVVFSGKVTALAAHFGSTKSQIHAGIQQVNLGRMKSYKGWKYIGIDGNAT